MLKGIQHSENKIIRCFGNEVGPGVLHSCVQQKRTMQEFQITRTAWKHYQWLSAFLQLSCLLNVELEHSERPIAYELLNKKHIVVKTICVKRIVVVARPASYIAFNTVRILSGSWITKHISTK